MRLIAATALGLTEEVKAGRFREDLYYRIKVLEVSLPPLRERGYDVLLLAQHFIDKHAARSGNRILGLTPGAAGALLSYDWPGNVRELENCIEAAVALARYDHVTENELPSNIRPLLGESEISCHEAERSALAARRRGVRTHCPRATRGQRQQGAGRAHPRARSQDALSKAQALRSRSGNRPRDIGALELPVQSSAVDPQHARRCGLVSADRLPEHAGCARARLAPGSTGSALVTPVLRTSRVSLRTAVGKSSKSMRPSAAKVSAACTQFSSSRTLPGHE